VNSLKDFVALAKSSPGKITFGSPGTATPSHLTGELLALATGTQLTHVPYKVTHRRFRIFWAAMSTP
jgi:tripartite-type tricarboxylate transporter receptor subunit TctC